MIQKLVLIFVASGAGGLLRYALAGWTQRRTGMQFPIGTLVVNVTGCLLIGFLAAALSGRWMLREELRIALLVGLLGGYTTFSTFGFETFNLLNDGQAVFAVLNIVASVTAGVAAVWLGYRFAETWLGV